MSVIVSEFHKDNKLMSPFLHETFFILPGEEIPRET